MNIFEYIDSFSELKKGWDGYSAVCIKNKTIENTKNFLKKLDDSLINSLNNDDIVPSPYGTISIYFSDNDYIEIGIDELSGSINNINFNININMIDMYIEYAKKILENYVR
jgi:hypothetical protein